jgi:GAF domain-containing protein
MTLDMSLDPADSLDEGDSSRGSSTDADRARPTPADSRAGSTSEWPAAAIVHAVEEALERDDIGAAIALLNARTRFRHTAVYRADPPHLHNIYLYDRENPTLNLSGATSPLEETYCSFVCTLGTPFVTPDAAADDRLVAHAARARVISYCGVPLRLANGRTWGTLCHFDVRPRLLPPMELEMLARVAPVIARWASGGGESRRAPRSPRGD